MDEMVTGREEGGRGRRREGTEVEGEKREQREGKLLISSQFTFGMPG